MTDFDQPEVPINPTQAEEADKYWQTLNNIQRERLVPGYRSMHYHKLMEAVYRKMQARRASLQASTEGGDVVISVDGRAVVRFAASEFQADDPELLRQLVQEKLDSQGEEFLRAAVIHKLRRES